MSLLLLPFLLKFLLLLLLLLKLLLLLLLLLEFLLLSVVIVCCPDCYICVSYGSWRYTRKYQKFYRWKINDYLAIKSNNMKHLKYVREVTDIYDEEDSHCLDLWVVTRDVATTVNDLY